MVEILHVVVHLEHVVDDGAIDGSFEERLRAQNHVVATDDALCVGISYELVHDALATEMFLHVSSVVKGTEFFAVVVCIFEAELCYDTFGEALCVVGREGCGVFCHEVVRHDASSAVYGASDACVVFLASLVDAVL